MAEEKKKPLAFSGESPKAIDHRNPPKPPAPVKSAPAKPDHFTRETTAPISAPVKPVAPKTPKP